MIKTQETTNKEVKLLQKLTQKWQEEMNKVFAVCPYESFTLIFGDKLLSISRERITVSMKACIKIIDGLLSVDGDIISNEVKMALKLLFDGTVLKRARELRLQYDDGIKYLEDLIGE